MTPSIRAIPAACLAVTLAACAKSPPPSQLPDAQAAIDRMRATTECATGVRADAAIDHFSDKGGRVRAELLMLASRPARIRMDVMAPVVGSVATLASDGEHFALNDMRNKQFLVGPASACNIARITQVPIPGNVLVSLLVGRAPVLVHTPPGPPALSLAWSGSGYYVVGIDGTPSAREEIHLQVHPDDWSKPWQEQRLRVIDVEVWQQGQELYDAELTDYRPTGMAAIPAANPLDAVLGETPLPPSGPQCNAELPRRIHVNVPGMGEDVLFRYDKVELNPPLPPSSFTLQPPSGVPVAVVTCEAHSPATSR